MYMILLLIVAKMNMHVNQLWLPETVGHVYACVDMIQTYGQKHSVFASHSARASLLLSIHSQFWNDYNQN